MRKYLIEGGHPVNGEIQVLGAKNFVTKALVAALLGDSKTTIFNVPSIGDVELTVDMIRTTGCSIEHNLGHNSLTIDTSSLNSKIVTLPGSGSNRIPILMIAALLKRFGRAEVPALAGCKIGERKVDFHVMALEQFGAKVEQTNSNFIAYVEEGTSLKGARIELPYPSVGATESSIFLGCVAEGKTIITNAAIEPEIMELITMLQSMGAVIFVKPNRKIVIEGGQHMSGTTSYAIADRIDAASWAALAAASNGHIKVNGLNPNLLGNFLSYFQQVGGGVDILGEKEIMFYRKRELTPAMIETDVFPGFSTDWQQPFAILLTQAEGISVIHETVYENRFGYLNALNKFGANTQLSSYCLGGSKCRFNHMNHLHSAIITGKTQLTSNDQTMSVPDLRAGLAYVIAAAIAKGWTTLENIEIIERGYGDLIERCKNMSLSIQSS